MPNKVAYNVFLFRATPLLITYELILQKCAMEDYFSDI